MTKIPNRPPDPFAPPVKLRPAEAVPSRETTAEDLRRAAAPGRPVVATPAEEPAAPAWQNDRDRALALIRKGHGVPEVARTVKRPAPTVYNWCRAAGLVIRGGRMVGAPKVEAEDFPQPAGNPDPLPEGVDLGPVPIELREEPAPVVEPMRPLLDLPTAVARRAEQAAEVATEIAAIEAAGREQAQDEAQELRRQRDELARANAELAPLAVLGLMREEQAAPAPAQRHVEYYVGPPRQVQAEQEVQRLRLRLAQVEQGARTALHILRSTGSSIPSERINLAGQFLDAALAPAKEKP